jgi:hypothetical protein
MGCGRLDPIPLQGGQPPVGGVAQRAVHCEALLHRWVWNAVAAAVAVGLVGQLLVARREVVLARGRLTMRQERRSLAHQRTPAPE